MRRTRVLFAAAASTVIGLVMFTGAAHAEEATGAENPVEEVIHEAEANGASHSDAECIEILAEGGTIDECREAPNPLLPETNEIIWGAVGFLVVFGFLAKFGFPAIKAGLDARTERIQSEVDTAERQRQEASQILEQYQRQLADAKSEANRIIEESRQQAEAMRRDLQTRAEADAADIRARAQADIDSMVAQARTDLQSRVSELSIQLAEKVVERSLDRDTNIALIDSYIRELESQGS